MSKELLADLSGLPETGLAVVGFSGGADSTALSHLLLKALGRERVLLAHVNHMLRGQEAERDEAACREFARQTGLRLVVSRQDVKRLAREQGLGLEECGRRVRYEFLESLAPGENDRVLTAHNADDNAETLLLHLCRGTGLSGLCGIPYSRGKLLRPLLRTSREDIEAYCKEQGLSYVQDSTNFSEEYARNKLRLSVLPVLRELNPRVVEAMARTMELLCRDRDFLSREAEGLLEQAKASCGLQAAVLLKAPEALRAEAVRLWLLRLCPMDLERKHLDAALCCLEQGGAASLPGGVTVRRACGVLFAGREQKEIPFSVGVGLGKWPLPDGRTLILEKKAASQWEKEQKIHNLLFKTALGCDIIRETPDLTARTRREGDRLSPPGRGLSKPLKQLFQEAGIPPKLRKNAVLLEWNGRVIWCEGIGPAEGFQVTEQTKDLLLITLKKAEMNHEEREKL